MTIVSYGHDFPYITDTRGNRFPALLLGIQVPQSDETVDLDAYLDTGASTSLFDGSLLRAIGVDLWTGEPSRYEGTSGTIVEARVHPVELVHDTLGVFRLRVGFSLGTIKRNLLGRDFFDLTQIGFREREQKFFVEPTP